MQTLYGLLTRASNTLRQRRRGGPKGASARLVPALTVAALCGLASLAPQKAEAIGTLTGNWWCDAYAQCEFTVTSNNHPAYSFGFGDGASTGVQTSKTAYHFYSSVSGVTPVHFTAYILAYATTGGGSPDNIIACNITTYRTTVGGDPTTFSGTCS